MISVFFSLAAGKSHSHGNSPNVPVHGLRVGTDQQNQQDQSESTSRPVKQS